MKKKILAAIMLVFCATLCWAQTEKTHTLMRGETLASVAKKYGITLEELKKANPAAEKVHYVGMSLIIPQRNSADISNLSSPNTEEVEGGVTTTKEPATPIMNKNQAEKIFVGGGQGGMCFDMNLAYILSDYYKKFNMDISAHMGYRYYPYNNLFVEGLLGYRGLLITTPKTSGKKGNALLSTHCVSIPFHVGALIPVTKKFGIVPVFGPQLDISVASKFEEEGKSIDMGAGNLFVTLDFGVGFKFETGELRIKYGLGVGKAKGMDIVGVGYSVGI